MAQVKQPFATLSRDEIERFRRGDILLSDEQANRFCDLALSALSETPQKPVAWAIRAKRDGSISEEVAPVGWTSFDKRMEQMKQHSWVVNDVAEIVPLYLGAASVPSAIGRRETELKSALLELYTLCTDMGWHAPDNRYHTITRAAELIK